MLSRKQAENVCMRYGGAKRCRYLDDDDKNYQHCHCLKLTASKANIDAAVKDHISKTKKSGQDPDLQGVPIGDGGNCSGYPYLKTVKMGYDVKK